MARYDFDMLTIGAGSGGVASSRRAGGYGARVAIVEESRIGGTCVLRGCVPKKLLVYGAQFADAFADSAGFGWSVAPPRFDWPSLIAAKNNELDRLEKIYVNMLRNSSVEIIEGRGVLVDPHTVEAAGRHYTAENILIATGGHPTVPDIPGIEHVISSNEALDLPELPRKIVIVGGGYIAVEFAGIFRGFGSEVVEIIRREELLYGFDDDLRIALAQEMRNRGIEIHTRTNVDAHREGPARGLQCVHRDRPGDFGRSGDVRDRARPEYQRARPRRGRDRNEAERRRRRRRMAAQQRAEYLRGRRRDRPAQPDPGGDRRGARDRRDAVQQQPDQDGSRRRSDRGIQQPADRHGRADRGAGAPAHTATMSISIPRASGR